MYGLILIICFVLSSSGSWNALRCATFAPRTQNPAPCTFRLLFQYWSLAMVSLLVWCLPRSFGAMSSQNFKCITPLCIFLSRIHNSSAGKSYHQLDKCGCPCLWVILPHKRNALWLDKSHHPTGLPESTLWKGRGFPPTAGREECLPLEGMPCAVCWRFWWQWLWVVVSPARKAPRTWRDNYFWEIWDATSFLCHDMVQRCLMVSLTHWHPVCLSQKNWFTEHDESAFSDISPNTQQEIFIKNSAGNPHQPIREAPAKNGSTTEMLLSLWFGFISSIDFWLSWESGRLIFVSFTSRNIKARELIELMHLSHRCSATSVTALWFNLCSSWTFYLLVADSWRPTPVVIPPGKEILRFFLAKFLGRTRDKLHQENKNTDVFLRPDSYGLITSSRIRGSCTSLLCYGDGKLEQEP